MDIEDVGRTPDERDRTTAGHEEREEDEREEYVAAPAFFVPRGSGGRTGAWTPRHRRTRGSHRRGGYARAGAVAATAGLLVLVGFQVMAGRVQAHTVPPVVTAPKVLAGSVPPPSDGTAVAADATGPTPDAGSQLPAPAAKSAGSGGRPERFTAMTGPGCPNTGTVRAGTQVTGDGWHVSVPTGWRGSGCGGAVVSTQMAGHADPAAWDDSFVWTFSVGYAPATCRIRVHVPPSRHADSTGHYRVSSGSVNVHDRISAFVIDQTTHRDNWVDAGAFDTTTGVLRLELDDNGPGDEIAAALVQITC